MANNYPALKPSLNIDNVNGIYVDSRITFVRAGGRTFFDDEVVKAEENLFLQSQTFDNASWTKSGATVTANAAVAPDGTTTADKLVEDASAGSAHAITSQNISVVSGLTYFVSIFAEASERSIIRLSFGSVGFSGTVSDRSAWFDLSAGSVLSSGSGTTAQIVDVGGGIYRLVISRNSSASTSVANFSYAIQTADAQLVYDGDGTSGIFIWGAQLEQRSSVTAYTATTTQPITRYQRQLKTAAANEWPREFDPVTGECLGRSVWESRTNLLTYSEDFTNAAWTKTNSTISADQVIAPDGTLTADKIVETTANSVHTAEQTFSATSGTTYTVSAYVKKAERGFALIAMTTAFPTTSIQINLTTGAVTTGTGTPLNAFSVNVGNGWYRVGFSLAATSTTTASANYYVSSDGIWAGRNYVGTVGQGIYIWGAQLE